MLETIHETAQEKIDNRNLAQVERILRSENFRNSEVLRHLLSFLADKTFSGEADALKEYTVAIDALRKPATYNPQHDSTVRLQVSRLRQKLEEYYNCEGNNDPIIVDIPKGHYKLTFKARVAVKQTVPLVPRIRSAQIPIWIAILTWLVLLIPYTWRGFSPVMNSHAETMTPVALADRPLISTWTPEIQALWGPFLVNNRPVILAIEDPLFVELQHGSGMYYRDRSIDEWDKLTQSTVVVGLRRQLNNPPVAPSHYYSTIGEVNAAFLVGRILAGRQQNISLVRSTELSYQQMTDNNVLVVGKRTFFETVLQGLTIHPQFVAVDKGVENLSPNSSEPKLLSDQYSEAPTEDGEVYALVTRLPGMGEEGSEFASFISNRAPGYVGALQWFTSPENARILITKLTNSEGEFPKYYQVVLKIKFKNGIPTNVSYVASCKLN